MFKGHQVVAAVAIGALTNCLLVISEFWKTSLGPTQAQVEEAHRAWNDYPQVEGQKTDHQNSEVQVIQLGVLIDCLLTDPKVDH